MLIISLIIFGVPILLIFYDVLFPKTNFAILKEKIFLKLGTLGLYEADFILTGKNIFHKTMSPIQYFLIFCSITFFLIYLLKNRITKISPYDSFCILFVLTIFIFHFLCIRLEGFFRIMGYIPLALITLLFLIVFSFRVFQKLYLKIKQRK
ncbi:hypothetical protein CQA62_06700 [Helicobacter cholecystus]|uniref:Uncharacterized protein n=1 Tax=Helicobacter cholecystus TaxID=45498 RepID=A0A3D8IT20_9HELI|nr:hypothetical protein CQA62_06700 [Helicobacter cholecystus]VEJ24269.1 Uncharacterised protein [Helicobacter cholecystus]